MKNKIRFGDFVREVSIHQSKISFNDLIPPDLERLKKKHRLPKPGPTKLQLRPMDVYRLLRPYVSVRFIDQFKTVVPLAIYLVLFQLFILRQNIDESMIITGGLLSVIVGLMLFMEGLKQGLMPFGESIGHTLPEKSPLWIVLLVTFLLGIGVTFAEPAIGALKTAGSIVNPAEAPYLYALLNLWTDSLVLIVGIGVGLAAIIGTLRFIYGWSLKPIIWITLIPTLGLTTILMINPDLQTVLGLAWDCGAVTTGPVTVPLVLSLGIGVAAASGRGSSSLSGFGIVTLASLFPILGVMILSLYVSQTTTPTEILELAASATTLMETKTISWMDTSPGQEIILGARAIIPLVLFLLFVMKVVLREKIRNPGIITYGIILCVTGMMVFNLGLTYGLGKLGAQSGSLVPAAFAQIETVSDSPLYHFGIGILIAVLFAWFLGFGATLAEPALNALGLTVQNLTNGVFKKSLLMYAVSIGVGTGIALGVMKLVFGIPIAYLILPGYALALFLTTISTEEFVNVAWDSAGVTTGPVTVPLVLAMGLGFGDAVNAIEGFGILSMASICPILSVLITGLYVQNKASKKRDETNSENRDSTSNPPNNEIGVATA